MLLELLGFGMEIALGLTALVREHEESQTSKETCCEDTRHVDGDRACGRYHKRSQADCPGDGDRGNSVPHGVGKLICLRLEVVAVDLLLSAPGHGLKESATIVAELATDLTDESFLVLGQTTPVDVIGDALPDLLILVDHPVDQLVDDRVDLLFGARDELARELAADLVLIQEVEDAS